jgi:hypothetical protein
VRNVYNEGGVKAILDGKYSPDASYSNLIGLWPRLFRTTIMNFSFFLGYSYLREMYQNNPDRFPH